MGEMIHGGHRARMREKFLLHGSDVFATHELLEMLLYTVIPYRDTNPIAHALLRANGGTLDGVFSAEAQTLTEISGVGNSVAAFLLKFGKTPVTPTALRAHTKRTACTPDTYGNLLVTYFAEKKEPECVILALDNKNAVIALRTVGKGALSAADIRPRDFLEAALASHASSVVIGCNHPYGAPIFSRDEMESLRAVREVMKRADVPIRTAVAVSGKRFASSETDYRPRVTCGEPAPASDRSLLVSALSPAFRPEAAEGAADLLLSRYATAEAAVSAPLKELLTTPNLDENYAYYLKIAVAVDARRRTERMKFGTIPTSEELRAYLIALFDGVPVEEMFLLSFDKRGALLSADKIAVGVVNASAVNRRKVLEVAVGRAAASVILVHNHPSGTANPSSADLATTASLLPSLSEIGVKFTEHYIVAGSEVKGLAEEADTLTVAADPTR